MFVLELAPKAVIAFGVLQQLRRCIVELIGLVIGLALVEYLVFGGMVGWARGKYGVDAPATTGHEVFERYYRAHQNTLEGLVVFIPALVIFAEFMSLNIAAALGGVFIVGRAIYFYSYVKNPASRGLGFMVGFLASVVLLLGGIVGALMTLF